MKKIIFGFICFLGLANLSKLQSQDLHLTNYHTSPILFNAGQIGNFAGTYRIGGNYRDQWRTEIDNPFQSASVMIDSPIAFGFTKQHWIGIGAILFYDKAGEVPITWSAIYPGVSYNIGLDKKFKNVFTIGAQYGFSNRAFGDDNYRSESEILGISDPDRQHIEDFTGSYGDLNVGVVFKSNIDKISKFEIGASLQHVLNPEINFSGDGGISNIGRRINGNLKYRRASSKRMIWEPSAWASFQGAASNIQLQLRNEFLLKKKGNFVLISGLGFRVGDSAQLLLGARYNDWLFMASYDHGVSQLSTDGIAMAYEFGVSRIFVVNKKPEVKPVIFCPRL